MDATISYMCRTQSGTEVYRHRDWNLQSSGSACRCGSSRPRPHRKRHLMMRLGMLPKQRSSCTGVQVNLHGDTLSSESVDHTSCEEKIAALHQQVSELSVNPMPVTAEHPVMITASVDTSTLNADTQSWNSLQRKSSEELAVAAKIQHAETFLEDSQSLCTKLRTEVATLEETVHNHLEEQTEEQRQNRSVIEQLVDQYQTAMEEKEKIEALYLHRYMKSTEIVGNYLKEFNEALKDKQRLLRILRKGEFLESELKENLVKTEEYLKLKQEKNRLAEQTEYLATQNVTQELRIDRLEKKVQDLSEVLSAYETKRDACQLAQASVISYLNTQRQSKQRTVIDMIMDEGLPDGDTTCITAQLEKMATDIDSHDELSKKELKMETMPDENPTCITTSLESNVTERSTPDAEHTKEKHKEDQEFKPENKESGDQAETKIKNAEPLPDTISPSDDKENEDEVTSSDDPDRIDIPLYVASPVGKWIGNSYQQNKSTKIPRTCRQYTMFGKS